MKVARKFSWKRWGLFFAGLLCVPFLLAAAEIFSCWVADYWVRYMEVVQMIGDIELPTVLKVAVGIVGCVFAALFIYAFCGRNVIVGEEDMDRTDFLNRDVFVDTLLARLQESGTESRYVGVYGKWGEGKTFVYRMLNKKARGNASIEFLQFSPWNIPDGEICAQTLFGAIAAQTTDSVSSWFKRFASCFDASIVSAVIDKIPIVGSSLAQVYSQRRSIEYVKEQLQIALLNYGRRIVIALDDVDRLAPAEVYSLLRLIKTNGDLPNITYLILGDKRYMADALDVALALKTDESSCDGLEYLEKIIPVECDLPAVASSELVRMALDQMEDLVDKYESGLFKAETADVSDVAPLIKNMRDVERWVDAVGWAMAFQIGKAKKGGRKQMDVDIEDLIAVSAIRLFAKDFYSAVYAYMPQIFNLHDDPINGVWVKDRLVPYSNQIFCDVCMGFLKRRLNFNIHGSLDSPKAIGIYGGYDQEDQLKCKLRVESYFPNYFCGANVNIPGQDDEKMYMELSDDEERLVGFLQKVAAQGNLKRMLDIIDALNKKCTERQIENTLGAFAVLFKDEQVGGYSDKNITNLFLDRHYTLYDRMGASVRHLVMECWPDIDKRSKIIVDVIKRSESLDFAARCLVTMREFNSVLLYKLPAEYLWDESSRHWAFEWLMDRIESGGRSVWSGGDVFAKRKAWYEGVVLSKDEQRVKMFKQQFITDMRNKSSDLREFYVALWPFVEAQHEAFNDRVALTFKFGEMDKFGDMSSLADALVDGGGNSLLCRMFAELMDFKAEQERANVVYELETSDFMKAWDPKAQANHMREKFPRTVIEQAVANGTFV